MKTTPADYVIRMVDSPLAIDAAAWNGLLALQNKSVSGNDPKASAVGNPFMRHEYLCAMDQSGSATPETGWTPRFFTLWQGTTLAAACALYLKTHSYGEYVFDHAWANAYRQHGMAYYPKALIAAPFTPVPGPRLLAVSDTARQALVAALLQWCQEAEIPSLHLLFGMPEDIAACEQAGLLLRQTVQFHWTNRQPEPWRDFDDFLHSLNQEKRKKIRQERRKVADAGIAFRWARGVDISQADWDFFYRCYERTYLEHGNAPYLSRDFFARMASDMPENWLLFVGEYEGQPVASSLKALCADVSCPNSSFDVENKALSPASPVPPSQGGVAYGRYWGALARVDCLHFEACYYQPLAWCIAHGFARFEGGAQGEHKMARALLPVATHSAHWLAHPQFSEAISRYLAREADGIEDYQAHLAERNPFKTLV